MRPVKIKIRFARTGKIAFLGGVLAFVDKANFLFSVIYPSPPYAPGRAVFLAGKHSR